MDTFHPGKKTLVFSILFAFLSTKNGRNLGAEIIHKHIKRTVLFWIPLSLRCKIVLAIMNMSIFKSRAVMFNTTRPWGGQWDYITKIDKGTWSGHWIIPGSDKPAKDKRIQWVEQSSTEAGLVIYYIHGGGFRVGDSLMYMDSFVEIIDHLKQTKGMDACIFSIDYSRSPEVKYNRTKEDCLNGYRYLVNELKIDPKRIVFMGDSAGGNLVANCMIDIRDSSSLSQPAGNVQISPWATIDNSQSAREGVVYQDCLEKKTLMNFDHKQYFPIVAACSNEADRLVALRDASISPLYGSFVGLCPTLVTYGGTEIFQHDIKALIECYKRDKVQVDVITRKAPHIWIICFILSPNYNVWKGDCSRLANWCAKCVV